nr:ABC transporter permease [Bacteroidales bacterium]
MKNKGELLIKVLSLGAGLAVGIVLIAKVCFEMSYDGFYDDVDRIYSIHTWYDQNGVENDYHQVSGAVAVGFMNEVPGVEYGTRTTFVYNTNSYIDEYGNKLSAHLALADTCFFKVFSRPILSGDPLKALDKPRTVMVSRSFAEKILRITLNEQGEAQYDKVIGMRIHNSDRKDVMMTIEGVFEDFPKNGTLDYDILLSSKTFGSETTENWMGNDRYKGYVKLAPGVDPSTLAPAIRKMQEAHQPLDLIEARGLYLKYYLAPFSKLHTSDPEVKSQVIMLSLVALLLISISLLNYILIVISSMVKRSKEIGVRRCYGAETGDIYKMLSKEAGAHILLSLILASVIIALGHGLVENLIGVPFTALLVPLSVSAIVSAMLFVLVVAIVIPAEVYRHIPVFATLKNFRDKSRRWKLLLLGVQVLINVFLVVMMLVIGRQYNVVTKTDPGYDYKDLYYFDIYGGDYQNRILAVKTLESLPQVRGITVSYNLPCEGSTGNNVRLPNDDRELFNIADQYECSENYCSLLGIPFVSGRAPRDSSEVAVDEKFVRKMMEFGYWEDGAVGKPVSITGHDGLTDFDDRKMLTVSGVYRSYLIGNLMDVDERPSALFYGEYDSPLSWMPHIIFKAEPG